MPFNASEISDALALLREDEANWYFVPILGESDTAKTHPPEVAKLLATVGSYIYGPSTIYSGHCPSFAGQSQAGLQHHEEVKEELAGKFGWLFDRVKDTLRQAVAPDEVDDEWISYPYVKMHRGDTLDGLPDAMRKMVLSPAPPHHDEQFKKHINDIKEQQSAQTLTFTLPLQVPDGGASLRVYNCFYDKGLSKIVDKTGNVLPQSSDYCRRGMPYEDATCLCLHMLKCCQPVRLTRAT